MIYNVAIVDDHSVAQFGIEAVLKDQPTFQVVQKISSGLEIIEKLNGIRVNILILDVDLPGKSGIDFLRENRSRFSEMKIVLFTVHEGEGFFREAIRLGANGYILKSDNILNMPNALSIILAGEFYCSQKLMKYLVATNTAFALTEKEIAVLRLVANGHSAREIAERIGISRRTVEYYIAKLKEKFEAENLIELVNYAREKYIQ